METADLMDPTTIPGLITAILSGAVLLGLLYAWRAIRAKLDKVVGQTENSHQDSEYPNMREEITAIRKTSEQAVALVTELGEAQRRERDAVRRETEGVREDVRAIGSRLDTHIQNSSRWRRFRSTD